MFHDLITLFNIFYNNAKYASHGKVQYSMHITWNFMLTIMLLFVFYLLRISYPFRPFSGAKLDNAFMVKKMDHISNCKLYNNKILWLNAPGQEDICYLISLIQMEVVRNSAWIMATWDLFQCTTRGKGPNWHGVKSVTLHLLNNYDVFLRRPEAALFQPLK